MLKKDASSFIYFAIPHDRTAGVKIGLSSNPAKRVASLRSPVGMRMLLVGFVPGARAEEKALHDVLQHYRMHGEWFLTNRIVHDFIYRIMRAGRLPKALLYDRERLHKSLGGRNRFCRCGRTIPRTIKEK